MALLRFLNPMRYLATRVFIWFWLALLSIGLTMTVAINLYSEDVSIRDLPDRMLPPPPHLERELRRAWQNSPSLEQLPLQRQFADRPIVLMELNSQRWYGRPEHLRQLADLRGLDLDYPGPKYISTRHITLMGPTKINIAGQPILLFSVMRDGGNNWLKQLALTPHWLKFSVIIICSLVLSLFFAFSLTRPLVRLQRATEQLGQGHFHERVTPLLNRHDEIGQLGQAFDAMAEQIAKLVAVQKRLLADVSHELRSPLTRMQMAIGLAQTGDPQQCERHLERIGHEADLLDQMIGDVLLLSRLETAQKQLQVENITLAQLLAPVIDNTTYQAEQQQLTFTVSKLPSCSLMVDPSMLASAFDNVLRNALKYAKSRIELDAVSNGQQLTISIADDGCGVPETALAQLFEPFYRVSDARTRSSGGTGLGLAIAQHSVRQHQGQIFAQNNQQGGLTVVVTLPLSPQH